jgi:hypothetical protein
VGHPVAWLEMVNDNTLTTGVAARRDADLTLTTPALLIGRIPVFNTFFLQASLFMTAFDRFNLL